MNFQEESNQNKSVNDFNVQNKGNSQIQPIHNKPKNKLILIIVIILLVGIIVFFIFQIFMQKNIRISPYANSKIDIETFQNEDETWGYNIYLEGSLIIYQPNIPGASGLRGFETEELAYETAELVVAKLRESGELPSISEEELRDLDILE